MYRYCTDKQLDLHCFLLDCSSFCFFEGNSKTVVGEGSGTPLQYSCWKIPWTEEPGRLQSMGSLRVGHN